MNPTKANLGLATTRQLLRELAVRMEVTQNSLITQNSLKGLELAKFCREALAQLSPATLNYCPAGRAAHIHHNWYRVTLAHTPGYWHFACAGCECTQMHQMLDCATDEEFEAYRAYVMETL